MANGTGKVRRILTIRMSEKLHDALVAKALAAGLSLNHFCVNALERHYEQLKHEDPEQGM